MRVINTQSQSCAGTMDNPASNVTVIMIFLRTSGTGVDLRDAAMYLAYGNAWIPKGQPFYYVTFFYKSLI